MRTRIKLHILNLAVQIKQYLSPNDVRHPFTDVLSVELISPAVTTDSSATPIFRVKPSASLPSCIYWQLYIPSLVLDKGDS